MKLKLMMVVIITLLAAARAAPAPGGENEPAQNSAGVDGTGVPASTETMFTATIDEAAPPATATATPVETMANPTQASASVNTSPDPAGLATAREALVDFFAKLHEGDYAGAEKLYGGEYTQLREWFPATDPDNHVALLKGACTRLLKCLPVANIASEQQDTSTVYSFVVEFTDVDGSIFVRGPCCGASEEDMPPESEFDYQVAEEADGSFRVQSLPVYVP